VTDRPTDLSHARLGCPSGVGLVRQVSVDRVSVGVQL